MSDIISNIKDTGTVIARAGAGFLEDEFQFLKTIDREAQETFNQINGYNAGDTITISKPAQFTMGTTADITSTIQPIKEQKVTLALTNQRNVAIELTSADISNKLSLKSWSQRVLKPAMKDLAAGIEAEVLTAAKDAVYQSAGTAGSNPFDTDTMLAARSTLKKSLVPSGDLYALLDSAAVRKAVNSRKGLFNDTSEIAKMYKMGAMGRSDGFVFLENNLLPTHTNGNDDVFEVRTTVSVEGQSTLVVEGLTTTTGTVKKGTTFTIGSVYGVHPTTKATLPTLQQFVVTADATADGSGYATLSVSPAFYTSASGSLQNIDAFPVDGAAITIVGSASTAYVNSIAYHKSAFRFASAPLVKPDGLHMSAQETVNGISLRVIEDYAVLTDKLIMRIDVLYGFCAVRPEWACKLPA